MMMVGIGFKLALVPFHMWTPDVYQGAPAPVSAYIATVSKGAVMAILIRFFFNLKGFDNHYLFVAISAIAILSMFVGNILAIRQKNHKEAIGIFIYCKYGISDNNFTYRQQQGNSGFNFLSYIIFYYNNRGIWCDFTSLNHEYEAEKIEDFKGLFWKRPGIAIVFTLSLLSLAGIPVTAGFIAKFYVILEGMKAGLMVLIISLIINSVIGLYYYLRIITTLFSTASETKLPELSLTGNISLGIIAASILILRYLSRAG